jgi:hypothetical protein
VFGDGKNPPKASLREAVEAAKGAKKKVTGRSSAIKGM